MLTDRQLVIKKITGKNMDSYFAKDSFVDTEPSQTHQSFSQDEYNLIIFFNNFSNNTKISYHKVSHNRQPIQRFLKNQLENQIEGLSSNLIGISKKNRINAKRIINQNNKFKNNPQSLIFSSKEELSPINKKLFLYKRKSNKVKQLSSYQSIEKQNKSSKINNYTLNQCNNKLLSSMNLNTKCKLKSIQHFYPPGYSGSYKYLPNYQTISQFTQDNSEIFSDKITKVEQKLRCVRRQLYEIYEKNNKSNYNFVKSTLPDQSQICV